jgi:hypothetical protein
MSVMVKLTQDELRLIDVAVSYWRHSQPQQGEADRAVSSMLLNDVRLYRKPKFNRPPLRTPFR